MTTPTQTILQGSERVLSGPFDFLWTDLIPGGPNGPCVTVFGERGDFASLAPGDGCTLSRGSTLQSSVPVAFTGATLAQCVTDINAVFGIASGAPTDFAYAAVNAIALWDSTVGPNLALAGVNDLTGASSVLKDQTYARCGLPGIVRDLSAAPYPVRRTATFRNDDTSCLSSNAMPLPAGTSALVVEAFVGSYYDLLPLVAVALSDGTAPYALAGKSWLSQLAGALSFVDPNLPLGFVERVGPSPGPGPILSFSPVQRHLFVRTGLYDPGELSQRARVRVPVPPVGATSARAVVLGAVPASPGPPSWFGAAASVRAWAVG